MVKPPIPWFGGKQSMLSTLLPIIENITHKTFVDVFGGGGSVVFAKKPGLDIYNDLDSGLVNFYRRLRDDFEEFYVYGNKVVCKR